jgi:hypothetical protein
MEWATKFLVPVMGTEKLIFDDEAGFKLRAPNCYRKI